MICIICRQAEIIDGRLSVNFERGEMTFAINNVPVEICSGCGEAYVDEEVAVRLLRGMEEMSSAGIFNMVCEYDLVGE